MARNRLFFEDRKEWSERKHSLLRNYLRPFAQILGGRAPGAFCVDGFAGRGVYDDGQIGSSMMSAQLAAEFQTQSTKRLQCVNVERHRGHYRNLVEVTERVAPGLVHNLNGPFVSQLGKVLDIVKSSPALFFLDPYGVRGIEWSGLAPLATRAAPTELLVRLHTPFLYRLSGFLRSSARSARANTELLSATVGTDEWKRYDAAMLGDFAQFTGAIISSYQSRLKEHFPYVGSYAVRTIEAERLKYHMVFCTRHPKGAMIMSDIVYKTNERYLDERRQREIRRGVQLALMDPPPSPEEDAEVLHEEKVSRVAERVLDTVRRRGRMTYFEMKTALVEEFFGLVSDHYFRQAVKHLRLSGLLRGDKSAAVKDGTILEVV